MAENIDDITVEYTEEDKLLVKQLEKHILTRGSWTTIMFKIQEMDKNTSEYGAPKVTIRRYQKRGGVFRQQSKFNISSPKQGLEISKKLVDWFSAEQAGESTDNGDD
jgi:hypothetical protein